MITQISTKMSDAFGTMLHSPIRRNLKKHEGLDKLSDFIHAEGFQGLDRQARRNHFINTILSETLEHLREIPNV